jgi:hypothetical protein
MPVMDSSRLLTGKFRRIFSFHLTLFICLVACAPLPSRAQGGERPPAGISADSTAGVLVALVDAVVVDVQETTIRVEGGMLIDISQALISSIAGGQRLDPSSIKPGMRIRASVDIPDGPSASFVAKFIQVRLENEIVLVGRLQAIDLADGSITILNRQIPISRDAIFVFGPGRKKLKAGRTVTVVAKLSGTDLVAVRISLEDRDAYTGAGLL